MSNTTKLIFSLLLAAVIAYPFDISVLNPWDRTCCIFRDCTTNGNDLFWYLYVPADVVFNCEEIIQNPNRFYFHEEHYDSPGDPVHPDFSGYAWEINGCHFSAHAGGCANYPGGAGVNGWCDDDDDPPLGDCDDDDYGFGTNTWMKTWSDAVTRYPAEQCPSQFTVTRTWSSQSGCPNNAITSNQIIYVVDERAPNLEIPADTTVECPTNFVPDYVLGQAEAVDLCTTTSVSYTNSFTRSNGVGCNAGTLRRLFTASDRCGNSIQDTQTITIVDTTPPIIPQLESVTTTCDDIAPGTTGSPGATIDYYECEQFIKAGPSYLDFTLGGCQTLSSSFGCNQIVAGAPHNFVITAATTITLEFNDIRLEGRGSISVYDGSSNAAAFLTTITTYPGPGPITGSGNTLYVEYTPFNSLDTNIIDGFSAFYYGDKTAPDGSTTPTYRDATIPGPCQGTFTLLRTWYASDECGVQGSMTQTIFVVDNTPPTTNPVFPPQTNIVEQVDCLAEFSNINPALVDACSATGMSLTKEVTLGGGSGQNFAFSVIQTFTAVDGCDNSITWSYTQEIGYYPFYVSGVLPPYITNQAKGAPFTLTVVVAEVADLLNNIQNGFPTFCTSPVVIVADAGPALLVAAGSDLCWTQAANGLLYCDTTTATVANVPLDLVLSVPTDYTPNSIIISFTIAERTLLDTNFVPLLGYLYGGTNSDSVVVTFA